MRMRVGLGPVFAYEWLTTSRRWQIYAVRSLFVTVLLASLALVWWSNDSERSRTTVQGQAEVGQSFYVAIVGTQLVLLLLAAPAATAGAVCLDKARGTLTHLLVTDLSNTEIILGKLAARLMPVLGLVASALPALALGTLLGGIDPRALTGAFLVSLGVATLGCSLALVFSVWGTKIHEVLMATYAVLVGWVLASPALWLWQMGIGWGIRPPEWLTRTNPFWLAFANSWQIGQVDLVQDLIFLAATWGLSAGLIVVAILRVRAVAANQAGRGEGRRRRRWSRLWDRRIADRAWLGPRLDPNPVLWREWHRRRPSRWSRILWGLYAGAAILISATAFYFITSSGKSPQAEISIVFHGGQVAIGLLLLSITSATSLSEERVRGSLDVLLATPMSTRAIVLGKWWGAFRGTVLISVLPGVVTTAAALRYGAWMGVPLVVGLILAFGAALTSLGLALGTWIPRQGRVITITVTIYVLVTVGWLFICALLTAGTNDASGPGLASASPFLGTALPLILMQHTGPMYSPQWDEYLPWLMFWVVVYTVAAIGLLVTTLASFDRCLGRVSEPFDTSRVRPRPKPKVDPAAIMD